MTYRRQHTRLGACGLSLVIASALVIPASASVLYQPKPAVDQQLKQLSLAQLGDVEVTTASKEPEELSQTPAAIAVLTQDDIRHSGATSIPELLRLVPASMSRGQSDQWAVGVRGFNSQFSKAVLVLIDGRSVYTPLFEGVYWEVQDILSRTSIASKSSEVLEARSGEPTPSTASLISSRKRPAIPRAAW